MTTAAGVFFFMPYSDIFYTAVKHKKKEEDSIMSDVKAARRANRSFFIGYTFVFHSLLMYWIQGVLTTSGNNVFLPFFVNEYGWNRGNLVTLLTVAALVGVFGAWLFAQLVKRFGPRKVTTVALILGGIATILFGRVSSIAMFIIVACFIHTLSQGWAGVTTNTLIANWYPKRKAFVLGITTIGLPLASVAFVPLLNLLVNQLGFQWAYLCVGGFMIVVGIVSFFWIKDNPEQVGLTPDNEKLTDTQWANAQAKLRNFKSQWSYRKLVKDKNAWCLAFGFGLVFMCNKGMIGQLSFYFVDKGYEQQTAIAYIALLAILGIVGSFGWGIVDDRIGTKKTAIIYTSCYIIGFFLMFLPGTGATMWIGLVIFELCQGGIGNLIPSMMITTYGRYEFPTVNRLLNPVIALIYAFGAWAIGICSDIMGGTDRAPLILACVLAVGLILILFIKPNPRTDIDYDTPEAEEPSAEAKAAQ